MYIVHVLYNYILTFNPYLYLADWANISLSNLQIFPLFTEYNHRIFLFVLLLVYDFIQNILNVLRMCN